MKILIDGGKYTMVELLIEGTHTGPMNGMAPTGKGLGVRDSTIRALAEPIAEVVGYDLEPVFDSAKPDGPLKIHG